VFSPDGKQVVTAGEDGTAPSWACDVCDVLFTELLD